MQFRIATTFTASLAKLSSGEQTAVKTTVFDLQTAPTRPGFRMHRIEGTRDRNFRSARVTQDIRIIIIIHQSDDGMTLCYVDHHDNAYKWAHGRRMEAHPHTGAMQIVEIHETVREIEVPVYVEVQRRAPLKPPPAAGMPDDQLLSYGVPVEWLESVRDAGEDDLLDMASHLPEEAGEALLQIAAGGTPQPALPVPAGAGSFDHPDAMRRFRVMRDTEELAQALDYPWERWSIFLHPAQRARQVQGRLSLRYTVRSIWLARTPTPGCC